MTRFFRNLVYHLAVIAAIPCCAESLQWNWLNPLPTGNSLSRIIWTGKSLYACGGAGTIISSTDGSTWKTASTGVADHLIDIVSTGSRFVAVGRCGTILGSQNGADWTSLAVFNGVRFTAMVYTGEQIVAGGLDGMMYTSQGDFSVWTRQNIGTAQSISALMYMNKQIIAILACDTLLRSADGKQWKKEPFTRPECLAAAFPFDTKIYGFSWENQFLSSQDGLTWSHESFGGYANTGRVFPAGDLLFAITDSGSMYVRKPDRSWLPVSIDSVGSNLNAGTSFNGGSILVGYDGAMATIDSELRFRNKSSELRNLHFAIYRDERGYFVAGSEGLILRSGDGTRWTPVPTPSTKTIRGLASSKSTMVACGKNATIMTSPDGNSWAIQPINDTVELRSVACNGQRFVIVGRFATILYSDDGSRWHRANHDAVSSLWSVIWDGKQFVAAGEWGSIHHSPDGINWKRWPTSVTARLRSIAWTGKCYIVTGSNGTILTSENGTLWKTQKSPVDEDLLCVRWTGSRAIIIGNAGIFLHSPDGLSWRAVETNIAEALASLIAVSGHLIAVGNQGAIVEADESDIFPAAVLPRRQEAVQGGPAISVRNGKVMVTLSGNRDIAAQITVFTLQGRQVIRRNLSGGGKTEVSPHLCLGDIPPGVYLAEYRHAQTVSRTRLVLGK